MAHDAQRNRDLSPFLEPVDLSDLPDFRLSGKFNTQACVDYALECGLRHSTIHSMFNMRGALLKPEEQTVWESKYNSPVRKRLAYKLFQENIESEGLRSVLNVFKVNFRASLMSYLSNVDRDLFENVVGKAPSDKVILCDECVDPRLIKTVQKNFGHAINIFSVKGQGVKDPALIERMMDYGVDAIFSKDHACKTPQDLSVAMQQQYNRRDGGADISPPHLVLIPRSVAKAQSILSERSAAIQSYLDQKNPSGHLQLETSIPQQISPILPAEIALP